MNRQELYDTIRMTSLGQDLFPEASPSAEFASRYDTPEGQRALQELHDVAARGGAICQLSNAVKMARRADFSATDEQRRELVEMASAHEHSAITQIHDMTVDGGARCSNASVPVRSLFSATPDRDRIDDLLAMTPLGRTVLSERRARQADNLRRGHVSE